MASAIIQGSRVRRLDTGDTVTRREPAEERSLRTVRDELQKIQDDARAGFEAEQKPPYELLGDGLPDLDDEYMSSEEFRHEIHEADEPQLPNEWDKGPDPIL